ncbi:hypothetical protein S83_026473 [Arachis hypogaea]
MTEHKIHSTINLDTLLKEQHQKDKHETGVTPIPEEHQITPGYENRKVPNLEAHNTRGGTQHFAGLGDDYYHHAIQEMRHQELERHHLELERRLTERLQSGKVSLPKLTTQGT